MLLVAMVARQAVKASVTIRNIYTRAAWIKTEKNGYKTAPGFAAGAVVLIVIMASVADHRPRLLYGTCNKPAAFALACSGRLS